MSFKDNLLQDLMSEHGPALAELPEQRTRRSARPVLAAAGVLAVAGAATVALTTGGNAPEAYAVTKNPDGSVTVTIRDIKGVDAANAKLREYGIRAKAVPMSTICAELDESKIGTFVAVPRITDGSVTMAPNDVPEGYTVLLGISNMPNRGNGLGFTGPIRNPAPDCLREAGN
ncbi:hypothetical protein GCM10022267_31580 [Lentzea roselyniae]|uniref:PASTA domain-containing protein n=1 Tax=Lentzea roselyniae TaxID=531940 RepID=A0ABP7AX01_9PSEU